MWLLADGSLEFSQFSTSIILKYPARFSIYSEGYNANYLNLSANAVIKKISTWEDGMKRKLVRLVCCVFCAILIAQLAHAEESGKNEHFDLGIAGGLYGMSVDFKMRSETSGNIDETDFTVPLPVIGLRANFALTPKWFIRQSFDYFYINIGDYEGQLIDLGVALEWNALKYLGLGIGYNFVGMDLKYSGDDDFLDEIDMSYGGVQAFAKLYF